MTLSAEQYSQIAEGYENASADPLVPAERRLNLAKEANWFRFLAQRERAHRPNNEHELTAPRSMDFEPNSQGWSWRSTAPFLTTLWITGAAVYLVSTVLFTNAVNLFGTDEPKTPAPEIRQSVESVQKAPSFINTADQANQQPMAMPERRHAISPDEPTHQSPTLTAPYSPPLKEALPDPVSSQPDLSTPSPAKELGTPVPSEPARDVVEVRPNEMLIVTSAATIRNGPSLAAKKIGTATAGAELHVKSREKNWVQFVDPSSGNTGWIQSSLLAAASGEGVDGLVVPKAADTGQVKAKPKLAKKTPSPPSQISPQRRRSYADLPSDEEFFAPRKRGPVLLNRRRMLREGLLSPDFLPPE
jgi:hypothetical protein